MQGSNPMRLDHLDQTAKPDEYVAHHHDSFTADDSNSQRNLPPILAPVARTPSYWRSSPRETLQPSGTKNTTSDGRKDSLAAVTLHQSSGKIIFSSPQPNPMETNLVHHLLNQLEPTTTRMPSGDTISLSSPSPALRDNFYGKR